MVAFWQRALGYEPRDPAHQGWVVPRDPNHHGPHLSFQARDRWRPGRNWLHLDLRCAANCYMIPSQLSERVRRRYHFHVGSRMSHGKICYLEILADPDRYVLADYHGEVAAVLATLGRDAEAPEHYRSALTVFIRQDPL